MEGMQGHPIKVVVRRTGLSAHVIRVWERRYGAVEPARTETNRRLYSDEDIARLICLQQAIQAGHSIGRIARLPADELEKLVRAEHAAAPLTPGRSGGEDEEEGSDGRGEFLERAMAAVKGLDAVSLEEQLVRASVALSQRALIEEVVQPLMERIGRMWQEGALRVAAEHMATAVVRGFIGGLRPGRAANGAAPRVVATTPAGQMHELGALIASLAATSEGWNSTYLGPDLPAEEIAGAAAATGARAVLLSIVYPGDDPHLGAELVRLRGLLGDEVALLAGGRAAPQYAPFLERAGALTPATLDDLRDSLRLLRRETAPVEG